jgi:hypothetical protein
MLAGIARHGNGPAIGLSKSFSSFFLLFLIQVFISPGKACDRCQKVKWKCATMQEGSQKGQWRLRSDGMEKKGKGKEVVDK